MENELLRRILKLLKNGFGWLILILTALGLCVTLLPLEWTLGIGSVFIGGIMILLSFAKKPSSDENNDPQIIPIISPKWLNFTVRGFGFFVIIGYLFFLYSTFSECKDPKEEILIEMANFEEGVRNDEFSKEIKRNFDQRIKNRKVQNVFTNLTGIYIGGGTDSVESQIRNLISPYCNFKGMIVYGKVFHKSEDFYCTVRIENLEDSTFLKKFATNPEKNEYSIPNPHSIAFEIDETSELVSDVLLFLVLFYSGEFEESYSQILYIMDKIDRLDELMDPLSVFAYSNTLAISDLDNLDHLLRLKKSLIQLQKYRPTQDNLKKHENLLNLQIERKKGEMTRPNLEAIELIAKGKSKLTEGNIIEALRVFEEAHISNPENEEIKDGIEKCKFILGHKSLSMVWVQGGNFNMGAKDREDEQPIHSVSLDGFYIGKYEVSRKLWADVMNENVAMQKGNEKMPVANVSYVEVQTFIKKLNRKLEQNYRLPTEAEWEYAARGGRHKKKYIFSGSNDINLVGWYYSNSNQKFPHAIGTQKRANQLGIFDMSGNVSEWCFDWYSSDYYKTEIYRNPTGPYGDKRTKNKKGRVIRGGSFFSQKDACKVYRRTFAEPTSKNSRIGFRLVLKKSQ